MSAENRELLRATIYNLEKGSPELYTALAALTDSELEDVLNTILKR